MASLVLHHMFSWLTAETCMYEFMAINIYINIYIYIYIYIYSICSLQFLVVVEQGFPNYFCAVGAHDPTGGGGTVVQSCCE